MISKSLKLLIILIFIFCSIFFQYQFQNKRFNKETGIEGCSWCEKNSDDRVVFIPYKTDYLKIIAPADTEFIADIIWLRTCYYFGLQSLKGYDQEYLFFLLDKVTDLSESWEYPYHFGIVSLTSEAEQYFNAFILTEKGIKKFPDSWELFFFKGYILWKFFSDNEGASLAMFEASKKKEAPFFLAPLSISLAKNNGSLNLAKKYVEVALSKIKDPSQRKILLKKLEELTEIE